MKKPTALITGVGRAAGIGAGIARQLASDGWDLVLNYWPGYDERMPWASVPSGFEDVVRSLSDAGTGVVCLPGDLAEAETAGNLFRAVTEAGRSVDALVLCHCESVNSGIMDSTVESFDRHYRVNMRATWQLIREFALRISPDGGSIIALTSDALIGNVPYGATKAGLDRIVLACARELADRNIVANVINPGPIDTGWMDDTVRNACVQRQPSGRLGTPQDTANLVSFLLSSRGTWINGQLLKSDGGFST